MKCRPGRRRGGRARPAGVDGLIGEPIPGRLPTAADVGRQGRLAVAFQQRQGPTAGLAPFVRVRLRERPDDPAARLAPGLQHQPEPLPDDHVLADRRPAPGPGQDLPGPIRPARAGRGPPSGRRSHSRCPISRAGTTRVLFRTRTSRGSSSSGRSAKTRCSQVPRRRSITISRDRSRGSTGCWAISSSGSSKSKSEESMDPVTASGGSSPWPGSLITLRLRMSGCCLHGLQGLGVAGRCRG